MKIEDYKRIEITCAKANGEWDVLVECDGQSAWGHRPGLVSAIAEVLEEWSPPNRRDLANQLLRSYSREKLEKLRDML